MPHKSFWYWFVVAMVQKANEKRRPLSFIGLKPEKLFGAGGGPRARLQNCPASHEIFPLYLVLLSTYVADTLSLLKLIQMIDDPAAADDSH